MPQKGLLAKVGILIIVLIVLAGGAIFWQKKEANKSNTSTGSGTTVHGSQYYRGDSSYSLQIPDAYNYDDSSIPGVNILYPAGVQINASSEDGLYSPGSITILNDRIFNGDAGQFRNYVEHEVVAIMEKSKYTYTHSQQTVQGIDAERFIISKPYPKVQYYINTPTVVVVTSHEENSAMNTVLTSLQNLSNPLSSLDRDTLVRMNRMVIDDMQHGQLADLYHFTTQDIQKKITQDKFVASLGDESSKLAGYSVSFYGFVLTNSNTASFQSQFIAPDGKSRASLAVAMQKTGDKWEISGVTLAPIVGDTAVKK